MDVRELQRYKQLLLAKLDELSATRAEALAPVMGAREPRGDLIDQAAVQTEAELQIHLYQTDSRLSRAIEDALARINWGTFGACEACKQPISKVRLEAVPWTRLCRECKEQEQNPV